MYIVKTKKVEWGMGGGEGRGSYKFYEQRDEEVE